MSSIDAVRVTSVAEPTATLEEVDIRAELLSRRDRAPDYEREHAALAVLTAELAENPRNMLQKLVEVAVELCDAGTAGISLLEGDVFRWEALAGVFGPHRNSTMPRDASPCGVCVRENTTQLMYLPDRCFPALRVEPRFVEALLIPFHDHGTPMGTVWIATHDSRRKFDREDERIVAVLAQLASAGWQLWRACAAAEESSRRKDEFLAVLGHELRNPLAAIRSATGVLERLGATDVNVGRAAEVVARQSRHLRRLVDDLLDLSRMSRGTLDLQKTPIELGVAAADAVETTRPQMEGRRHRLSMELPAVPIYLEADPVRLTQLLANLLDNAAKYTPDGGHIRLTAEPTDGQVRIVIRDTGIGIPEPQLVRIFELFTRVGGPSERSADGLGIGLALVRRLAEMHGGTVEAASDGVNRGSRFTVCLPTTAAVRRLGAPPKAPRQPGAPTSRHVLLVEDNEDMAESLATLLASEGHSVRVAPDGPLALEAARALTPDVVLLDLGLLGMSGYEVARRMRENAVLADLTIIALSGYAAGEHGVLAKQAGCDAHLATPVDPDVLLTMLGGAAPRSRVSATEPMRV